MKKNAKKKRFSLKLRSWRVAIITTFAIGVLSPTAHALDLGKTISDFRKGANSLIEDFKNNPTVGKIVGELNNISILFMPEIQRITNLSNADADKIKGVLGQLTPTEAKKAVKDQEEAGTATNTAADSKVTRAVTEVAVQRGLSKEAQETNKKVLEEVSGLVEDSEYEASESLSMADEAQSFSSSQDVLKALSRQTSNQTALTAAQVRIAAYQNTNLQEIKTQLAVSNQANSSSEKRQEGKAQEEQIAKYAKSMSIIANKIDLYEK